MSKYNAKAILLGLTGGTVSKEDNDLNITINADHEGDEDREHDFDPDSSVKKHENRSPIM